MRSRVAEIAGNTLLVNILAGLPEGLRGAELVLSGYESYKKSVDHTAQRARVKNGLVFEALLLEALLAEDISPIYYQATVEHVPNVVFDILLYDSKRPAVLSCKTSLRERWKQADLEGTVLKQVYGGARSVLLTLSDEGYNVQQKIDNHEVHGLDEVIVISRGQSAFDKLLRNLAEWQIAKAKEVMPVDGTLLELSPSPSELSYRQAL